MKYVRSKRTAHSLTWKDGKVSPVSHQLDMHLETEVPLDFPRRE